MWALWNEIYDKGKNVDADGDGKVRVQAQMFPTRFESSEKRIYVRPLVEYASTVWSPSYMTLIDQLESVQRSFTKRLPQCQHLSYSERLNKLQLQSLEHRRLIFDLIMCYNIVSNNSCIDKDDFFKMNPNTSTRGHPFRIQVPLAKLNARNFFFCNRVVQVWNSLPSSVVEASSVQSFKFRIKKVDLTKFLRSN